MRIGAISDIHLDVNIDYPIIKTIQNYTKAQNLEILLVAGDISNNYKTTLSYLEQLEGAVGIPVYFVPGNHDMWDREGEIKDARKIYEIYAKQSGCLCNKNVVLKKDWSIIGSIGWYDYSFGDPGYTIEAFEKREKNKRIWQDCIMVQWHESDRQFHKRMRDDLEEKLLACEGKNVIALTHMIGTAEFKVPDTRPDWDYFNAFLGSREYGELFEKYHVSYHFMGHVHYRKQLIKNGVDYRCVCLNYHTEWQSNDLAEEVASAIQIIEI
ncbi:metallophosphoesterase [Clostridium boliviensis]|uniref:Metallophosphoesterase n=1 Tax=Clostridium boliviensis TaxID=318465 RepID=A0ABU4GWM8_9CLOT|nr:metallophosphoesterase [Clostridium boliviensis]MDW2800622.1 metallophosphoesterase [Clostridium boliviensis]